MAWSIRVKWPPFTPPKGRRKLADAPVFGNVRRETSVLTIECPRLSGHFNDITMIVYIYIVVNNE